MKKVYSRTSLCGMRVMLCAMQHLASAGGSASVSAIRAHVSATCQFSQWENEPVNGAPRWRTFLSFYSTQYAVAGLISKARGSWYLTDDGAAALAGGASDESRAAILFDKATESYRQSRAGQEVSAPTVDPPAELASPGVVLEDVQSLAADGFSSFIASLNAYEFQDLVAALLRSMGYFTPFVAPKGRDGGIDVLAFRDPLGATSPRLKVQVKHYPSTPVGVEVVRQLAGLLTKDGDAGVVVTSGTFTAEALREARSSHRHIRLIDGGELVSLWLEHYAGMADADKALMPVVPVFFVSPK